MCGTAMSECEAQAADDISPHFEHIDASRDEGVDDVDRAACNCPLQQAAIGRLTADIVHAGENSCNAKLAHPSTESNRSI